ncbi:MAG: imidazoleglycerol-phosphate dehydratase HisB [Phycisphaerales bacterium JB054]
MSTTPAAPRTATISRTTRETDIRVELGLDGSGTASIATGLGFFDHMLTALATHARIDLDLACTGDLHVDDHHTIEDCALALGQAFDAALGERRGITRFGSAYAPLDESLCRVVIDLSGRPSSVVSLGFTRETLGDVATENLSHFFSSFAVGARCTLHVDCLRGENDHHRAEAAFKAFALALRQAVAIDAANNRVPSTKGTLS